MERGWKVLATTSLGSLLVFIDSSILNVAFRSVVADFGVQHRQELTWAFSGYNIAFAAALLTAGRAADRFGRKRAFLTGIVIFVIGSALCGFAPRVDLFLAARVIQALGGALIVPSALALILPEFPPEKRSVAIGISGAVGGLSAAFGPALGGILVETFGWRSVFTVNIPIGAIALFLGNRILRESKDPTATGLPDPLGAILAMVGVGLLTAAIVQGDEWGWASPRVIGAVVIAIALLALLIQRCRTHPVPVMDLSLFRLRFFSAANAAAMLFSMGFYAMFFTNISFAQAIFGYSPIRSGLSIAPGPVLAAVFAGPAGKWAQQKGHKTIIVPGLGLFALGLILFAMFVTPTSSYWGPFVIAQMIVGIGVGLAISTLSSASNAYLPPQRFGMGSAINSTGRQFGAALGLAIVSALQINSPKNNPMVGFDRSWIFAASISIVAGAVMLLFFHKPTDAEVEASRVVA